MDKITIFVTAEQIFKKSLHHLMNWTYYAHLVLY